MTEVYLSALLLGQLGTSVGDLNVKLLSSLDDGLAGLSGHGMGNLGAVFSIEDTPQRSVVKSEYMIPANTEQKRHGRSLFRANSTTDTNK